MFGIGDHHAVLPLSLAATKAAQSLSAIGFFQIVQPNKVADALVIQQLDGGVNFFQGQGFFHQPWHHFNLAMALVVPSHVVLRRCQLGLFGLHARVSVFDVFANKAYSFGSLIGDDIHHPHDRTGTGYRFHRLGLPNTAKPLLL
ncbi:MAG: hypothetical protein AAF722_19465 [Cyanobacteria bacterium P01_C01_bin.70]